MFSMHLVNKLDSDEFIVNLKKIKSKAISISAIRLANVVIFV